MYYIDKKIEHLEGDVVYHYKDYYNDIDEIPLNLLTEVKECDKVECGYLEISQEGCERRIKSLVTKKRKVLYKAEIEEALKDISDLIDGYSNKIKNIPEGYFYNRRFNHNSPFYNKENNFDIDLANIANVMGFYIINNNKLNNWKGGYEEKIYLNKKDYDSRFNKLTKKYNKTSDRYKTRDSVGYLNDHTSEIIKKMFQTYFGKNVMNFNRITKGETMYKSFMMTKKLFKISYKELKMIVNSIEYYWRNGKNLRDTLKYLQTNKEFLKEDEVKLLNEYNKILK